MSTIIRAAAAFICCFFVVKEYSGKPEARVFEQITWVDLQALPTIDFLEGDIDFVRRLARGDFKRHLDA